MQNKVLGYILAFSAVILWAGNFVVARAMATAIPPIQLNFWRWLVAFLCLVPFALKYIKKDLPTIRQHLPYLSLLGFIGVTALNALFYKAGQSTSSINMVLFVPSAPIIIMLLSRIVCAEPITFRRLLGLGLILLGLSVLLFRGDWNNLTNVQVTNGDLWSIGGVMCFGVYSFLTRYRPKGLSFIGFHICTFGLGLIFTLPMLVVEMYYIPSPEWTEAVWFCLLYAGIGCSFIAYVLWTKAIDILGPVTAGMVYYSIPLFTALEGVLILGESIQSFHLVGAVLMIIGIIFALTQKNMLTVKSAG